MRCSASWTASRIESTASRSVRPVVVLVKVPPLRTALIWCHWPLFTVGLVQRGHSDDVIRKVLGENMLRVWRANRADAAPH